MPTDVKYNKSSGLIEATYSGEVTASELHDAVSRRIAIQKKTGALGVLADASKVQITPSTIALFEVPARLFQELNADRRTVTALVLPDAEFPKEMAKFFETASRNRGWMIQVFTDRQSAVAWLMAQGMSSKPATATE